MATARRRVSRWLGGREPAEETSETGSHERTPGPPAAEGDEVWRHADEEPLRVEHRDDERPGLSTYDGRAGRARAVDEPARSPRARRAADGQGLHDGEA